MRATKFGILMLSLLAAAGSASAWAVDLENHDRKETQVVINRDDGSSETITIKPGQKLSDICTSCVVLMGDNSVEARGKATIQIDRGKISLKR